MDVLLDELYRVIRRTKACIRKYPIKIKNKNTKIDNVNHNIVGHILGLQLSKGESRNGYITWLLIMLKEEFYGDETIIVFPNIDQGNIKVNVYYLLLGYERDAQVIIGKIIMLLLDIVIKRGKIRQSHLSIESGIRKYFDDLRTDRGERRENDFMVHNLIILAERQGIFNVERIPNKNGKIQMVIVSPGKNNIYTPNKGRLNGLTLISDVDKYIRSNISQGELVTRRMLSNAGIKYIINRKFPDLVDVKQLSYDFYLEKHKILIEIQGGQHREYIPYFHEDTEKFEKQLKHDKMKSDYVIGKNYILICIPDVGTERYLENIIQLIKNNKLNDLYKLERDLFKKDNPNGNLEVYPKL